MNEKIVGLFKCRNCGSIFDEKVEVTQSVSWAIKDMSKEVEYTTTAAFHGTSLPGRFIVHRCKKRMVLHLRPCWMEDWRGGA